MSTPAVLDPKQWYRRRGLGLLEAFKNQVSAGGLPNPIESDSAGACFTNFATFRTYMSKLANDIDSSLNLSCSNYHYCPHL